MADYRDSERDQIREQLAGALHHGFNNGYEAARDLERRYHWSPDPELVEILDGYSGDECSAEMAAVKAWVKETEPQPAFKIGDAVTATWGGEEIEGVIAHIDLEMARYTIRRAGDALPGQMGTQGAIVNWEASKAK